MSASWEAPDDFIYIFMDQKINDRISGTQQTGILPVAVFLVVFRATVLRLCLYFCTTCVEVLITESGFHLLLWKDLIYDKMSVEGLLGGVTQEFSCFSEIIFLTVPPVINDSANYLFCQVSVGGSGF